MKFIFKSLGIVALLFGMIVVGAISLNTDVSASSPIQVAPPCHFKYSIAEVNKGRAHWGDTGPNMAGYAVDIGGNGGFPSVGSSTLTCSGLDALASINGTAYTATDSSGGKYIDIRGADGITVRSVHLDSFKVSNGSTVKVGDVIGVIGMTGNANFVHIHFVVLQNGNYLSYHSDYSSLANQWEFSAPIPVCNPPESNDPCTKTSYNIALKSNNPAYYLTTKGGNGQTLFAKATSIGSTEKLKLVKMTDYLVGLQLPNGSYLSAENGGGGNVFANRTWLRQYETFRISYSDYTAKADVTSVGAGEALDFKYINNGDLKPTATLASIWERFLFVDRGNGTYNIRSFQGPYLWAFGGGAVNVGENAGVIAAASMNPSGEWERFKVINLGNNQIAIQSYNGKYLTAENGGNGNILANRSAIGEWEKFTKVTLSNGYVALRAVNGKYITATPPRFAMLTTYKTYVQAVNNGGGAVFGNGATIDVWETFTMEGHDAGFNNVYIRTNDGQHFLGADNNGGAGLTAKSTTVGNNQVFRIYFSPNYVGKFALKTYNGKNFVSIKQGYISFQAYNGKYLQAVSGGGKGISAVGNAASTWEKWKVSYL